MYDIRKVIYSLVILLLTIMISVSAAYSQDEDQTRNILKQGLIGAGTGAIASSASGGNAGKGALIGAGTSVIGSALLDALTTPSSPPRRYAPQPQDDSYYADQQDDYYYEEPPRESSTQKVLKQGLIGAGTGAIAAGTSGGNAGQGALIGAGTSVVGNALLDTLTQPSQPQRRVYRRPPPRQPVQQPVMQQVQPQTIQVQQAQATPDEGRKKVIKKYDENGKLVSEEEIYY